MYLFRTLVHEPINHIYSKPGDIHNFLNGIYVNIFHQSLFYLTPKAKFMCEFNEHYIYDIG